jgi:hypothetical protein
MTESEGSLIKNAVNNEEQMRRELIFISLLRLSFPVKLAVVLV